MHSILIIGCGSIGERHLRSFLRTGRADVTACEANPVLLQRMADTYKVRTFADATEALGGRFDAVVICTPAPLHVPLAIQALAAGKHALIEKPLSHSLAGVDELFRTREQSGKQVAVAYVHRVNPILVAAREFIASNELGPVLQATVTSGQPFHIFRPAYAQTYFRERRTGGGAIQDALTHFANWMEYVVGPADSVMCDCAHLALAGVEVEDAVHLSARHSKVLINYSLNMFQAMNESTLQFNTAVGSVKIEYHLARWGTFRTGDTAWSWRTLPAPERDTPFIAQAGFFLDQIEGKPPVLCSLEAAYQTLRFNLAAQASAEAGARVLCASIHS